MASQEAESNQAATQVKSVPRPMSRRRKRKLVLAGAVIAAALVIVFWGWSSTGAKSYLQAGTLADAASSGGLAQYLNRTLEVQGVIVGWAGGAGDLNFSLADKVAPSKTINVVLLGSLPAEFANGKTAVIKGMVENSLPLVLSATEVTLGCASKY